MAKNNNEATKTTLEELLKHLETTKVTDVTYLNVEEYTPFASHYVLVTCDNIRFLAAMADDVEEFFEGHGVEITGKDGVAESGWMIVQGGEVCVHLFLPVNRKEINLEGFMNELAKRTTKLYISSNNIK